MTNVCYDLFKALDTTETKVIDGEEMEGRKCGTSSALLQFYRGRRMGSSNVN